MSELQEKLTKIFMESLDDPSAEAVDDLQAFADSLRSSLIRAAGRTGSPIHVSLVPGYKVNHGQQYNMILELNLSKREERTPLMTICRAYVRSSGYPVFLDFGEEEPVEVENRAALESAFTTFFSSSDMRQNIAQWVRLIQQR